MTTALHFTHFGYGQNSNQGEIYSLKSVDYKTIKIKEQVC